jgi:NAD(P)-dependent dehydrogenase (short-subunit alcohol dehydrogenase family)
MLVKDHAFVVTGGASGLGAAAARLLAVEGGFFVIDDVHRAALI